MKQVNIAIIGIGAVGSTIAYALMLKNHVSELILIDIDTRRCAGEVKDLADSLGFSSMNRICQGTYEQAEQADIVIIAAGRPQKPGQSRLELLESNRAIMASILEQLKDIKKDAIVIIVSNPLDILTYQAQQTLKLPQSQIFGTGTYLDSQRLKVLLSTSTSVALESIQTFVLGEHGDSQVVAWSLTNIAGLPVEYFGISPELKNDFAQAIRTEAYEIIQAKGATFYGIAATVADICETIILNKRKILPLSVYHEDYGVCLSVPVILGGQGIEKVPYLLNHEEQQALKQSARIIASFI